jgi:tetratricopeptide (TPR) repeat protein
MTVRRAALAVAVAIWATGCAANRPPPPPPAANVAPKFPSYPTPDVPAALKPAADLRERHTVAWRRLQSGDVRGAQREFTDIVRKVPTFYPSEAGLGFALLADRQFKAASARFSGVTARNERYLPAWYGQAEAQIGLENDAGAIAALERVLALDPKRDELRTRVDLLRFRQLQTVLEAARRARQADRLPEAQATLEKALVMAPGSALVLRDLAAVEMARGSLEAAEGHIRKAIQVDSSDAEAHAILGELLERNERYRDAAAAYAKAAAIDARQEWTAAVEALREKAIDASVPAEFRSLSAAPSVTRGQLAAFIGIRLEDLITAAPKRVTGVATDIRNHWAANWIVPVTQAGVMDIFTNHTFQPNATIRRSDLASILSQLIRLATGPKSPELTKWRAARPKFADLPATHLSYAAAALAVSAGAMTAQTGDRFAPTRPATGREVATAIARVERLAAR